jgi:probable HAF family extracellular repeat protein
MNSHSLPRILLLLSLFSLSSIAFSQTLQYTTLQVSPYNLTLAYGVNNTGDIVGAYSPNGFGSGFLYSQGSVQAIGCSGRNDTQANGINDNGVIVGWCPGNPEESFIYENGAYTYVSYPHALVTWFSGINNQGEVVGYTVGSGAKHTQRAFIYSNGKFTFLPATITAAIGINNNGAIAGTYCNSNQVCNGVVLVKGAKGWKVQQTIVYPGAASTYLNGINDNGDLAGDWESKPNTPQQAFVYLKSTNKLVGLNFNNGNNFAVAGGINNSGEIVGAYATLNGNAINGFYGTLQ